jgi:formate dehydrogenase alpha subunit
MKNVSPPHLSKRMANSYLNWDEALDLVATRFAEIKDKYGPDAFAALRFARCTNEENYLMQKFTRTVMVTNNVDHCARTDTLPP